MSEPVTPINELDSADKLLSPQPVAVPCPPEADAGTPLGDRRVTQAPRSVTAAAETVGAVVGKAVGRAREFPRRLQELRQRFVVVSGRTREDAASAAAEWKETAKHKAYETRTRAQQLAHDYPVQTILGAAGVAFVAGFALRIWRSNRA